MEQDVSEDYRRGWIECAEAIRRGVGEASTRIVEDFSAMRDLVADARRDAREILARAGDDPQQLRGVADFYEVILDLFMLRVEQEREFHAKRALRTFRERFQP